MEYQGGVDKEGRYCSKPFPDSDGTFRTLSGDYMSTNLQLGFLWQVAVWTCL